MNFFKRGNLKDSDREDWRGIGPVLDGGLSTASNTFVESKKDAERDSLDIQIIQRIKAMRDLEIEIEEILHDRNNAANTATTEEYLEDDGIEKLEQEKRRKRMYDLGSSEKALPENQPRRHKENNTYLSPVEDSTDEIMFLKSEIGQMKKISNEQATLIVALKKDQSMTIAELKKQAVSNEELRSLIAGTHINHHGPPSLNANIGLAGHQQHDSQRTQTRMLSGLAGHQQHDSQTQMRMLSGLAGHQQHDSQTQMRMLRRTLSDALGYNETISLDPDTFSLMMISPVHSPSWILGFSSFSFQMTLGVMIAIEQFDESKDSSVFGVPFKVNGPSVRVAQFLSIILCLSTQQDILTSIRSFILLGKGTKWAEIIGEEDRRASCNLWLVRVGLPNTLKLSQGLVVTFASFVIIVQNKDTIDLLKDFISLMVISEFDNILFHLASYGYLGDELRLQTSKISDIDESTGARTQENKQRNSGIIFVRFVFMALLSAMFAGWGIIFRMQSEGTIFVNEFPGCGKGNYRLAFEKFGDGKCYGGPFNTLNCKFEDGDCANFNTAYPSCNGKDLEYLNDVEVEVGNNKCNMDFAIPQCEYDGGDCCPYNVQLSPSFGDGKCDGGLFNTAGCLHDYEDCKIFNNLYRNCPNESMANSTTDISLGNGICEGGGYNVEECGFEFGDCNRAQIGQDILLNGVLSPSSDIIDLNMLMSSDGSKVLVDMLRTDIFGVYNDRTSNGTIARYFYNSNSLKWEQQKTIEKIERRTERDEYLGTGTAINGNGSVIAFGSPRYGGVNGRVVIYNFQDTVPTQIIPPGMQNYSAFGYRLDLTDDGLRIAVSSPIYEYRLGNVVYQYAGMIQVFERSNFQQESWTQVGDNIYGKKDYDLIGVKYLHINSLDGERIFSSARLEAPPQERDELRVHQFDKESQKWLQMEIDDQQSIKDSKDTKIFALAFSADGNRFALCYYSALKSDGSEIRIYGLSNGIWKQMGPSLLPQTDEFGPSISMNEDGSLLAASTAVPSCTGSIAYGNISPELCATGTLQLYQYKPTNPPHRLYSPLPINSHGTVGRKHLQEDEIILGLQISLSSDGFTIAVSGYNLGQDFGFTKVYNVTELFYIDCIVLRPENIGNGICDEYEPYYTERCGYDGGDCSLPSPVEGYEDCIVAEPAFVGNGLCYIYGSLPYISEQCGFDGGDCPTPSPVEGYPKCKVSNPEKIADGKCLDSLPYNSYECGFDGGDCLPPEYAPTSSPTESFQPQ